MIMYPFLTLNDANVTNQKVLLRLDLNLPLKNGCVADDTRLVRSLPTIKELLEKQAKIIILAHLGRPQGVIRPEDSLAPVAMIFRRHLQCPILFASDCIGDAVTRAIKVMCPSSILILENLRFHRGEEENNATFAQQLAQMGDLYVNDAFSCSHRAHASVVGITSHLPTYAGRAMEAELDALTRLLHHPQKPSAAIVGGAKISTKLELLYSLVKQMDYLILGGGMANTFLAARGHNIGESLCEPDLYETARQIMAEAKDQGCTIILPTDARIAISPDDPHVRICAINDIGPHDKIFDIGPDSVRQIETTLNQCKTVLWNGPLGLCEVDPYGTSSQQVATLISQLTSQGKLTSVAGGGDTLAVIAQMNNPVFTYTSTAGGAFLEWLEGKTLPGIAALSSNMA